MRVRFTFAWLFLASILLAPAGAAEPPFPIGDSPSLGPADAVVTIIEFLDFQ
jgi:hypothetical protein